MTVGPTAFLGDSEAALSRGGEGQALLPAESGIWSSWLVTSNLSLAPRVHSPGPALDLTHSPALPEPYITELLQTLLPEGSPGPDLVFLRNQEGSSVLSRGQRTMAQ